MNLCDLPVGRVILRGHKTRLRIFSPKNFFTCEVCGCALGNKAAKWESGGNITVLAMCLSCAQTEVEAFKKEKK